MSSSDMDNDKNREVGYKFIFDLETSGLPKRPDRRAGEDGSYRNLTLYDNARIVSIAWYIIDNKNRKVKSKYSLVQPDGFEISPESTAIHGITKNMALKKGKSIHRIFEELKCDFTERYTPIIEMISHNTWFDINVLKAELLRYKYDDFLVWMSDIPRFCTMRKSMKVMNVSKWPKLSESFRFFMGEDMDDTRAHNAEYDLECCYHVYRKLNSNPFMTNVNTFY